MILVDSNIMIDFWKRPSDEILSVFEKEDLATCGVVIAELLHGAVSEKNLMEMKDTLSNFTFLSISDDSWAEFGEMLYKLRISGLSLPFQDALIAFIAIKNNVAIYTADKHFYLIQTIYPELKLYA